MAFNLFIEAAAFMKTGDEASPAPTPSHVPAEPMIQDPQQQTGNNEQELKDEPITPTEKVLQDLPDEPTPTLTTKKLRAEDGSAVPTATLPVSSLLPSNVDQHQETSPPPTSVSVSAPISTPASTVTATPDPKSREIEATIGNMPAYIKMISNEEFASAIEARVDVILAIRNSMDPQALSAFVKDGGLKILNAWLEEASKDRPTTDSWITMLLRGLAHLPVTLDALKSSKIGKTLQKLSNTPDLSKETATQCVQLISKWKKVAHAASIAPDYIKDATKARKVKNLAEPATSPTTTTTSAAAAAASKKAATLTISSAKIVPLSADDIRKMKLKQRLLGATGSTKSQTPKTTATSPPSASAASIAAVHDTLLKEKEASMHQTHASSLVVSPVSPVSPQPSHSAPSSSMGVPASNGSVNKPSVTVKPEQPANRVSSATPATPPILLQSAIASSSTNGKKPRRRLSWAEGDKLTQVRTYVVEEPETPQQTGMSENMMTLIQTLLHDTHDEKQLEKQMLMKKREETNRRLEAMKPSVNWSKPTRGIWLVGTIEPAPTEESRAQIERERHVPAIPAAFVEKSPTEPRDLPPEESKNIPIIPGEEVQPQIDVIPPPPMMQLQQARPLQSQLYPQLPPSIGHMAQSSTLQQHLHTLADDPNLIMNLIGMLSSGQQTQQQSSLQPQPQPQPQPQQQQQQQQQQPFLQTPQHQPQMQAPQQLQAPQGLYAPSPSAFSGDFMQPGMPAGGMPYGQQFQQPPQQYIMMPQHVSPPMHHQQQQQQQLVPPPLPSQPMQPQYQSHGGMMMMNSQPQPPPPLSSHQQHYMPMQPVETPFNRPSQASPPHGMEGDRFYGSAGTAGSRFIVPTQQQAHHSPPRDHRHSSDVGHDGADGEKTPYLKRVPCRFFQTGFCKNGAQCQFYHQGVDPLPRGGLIPQPPEDAHKGHAGRRKDRNLR